MCTNNVPVHFRPPAHYCIYALLVNSMQHLCNQLSTSLNNECSLVRNLLKLGRSWAKKFYFYLPTCNYLLTLETQTKTYLWKLQKSILILFLKICKQCNYIHKSLYLKYVTKMNKSRWVMFLFMFGIFQAVVQEHV